MAIPFYIEDRLKRRGGPDEGGGEPRPRPEPRDMDGLFPRPERRTRLLKQPDVLEVANA